MIEGQFKIRCCSVMPQEDKSVYEYLPESPVNQDEFQRIARGIDQANMTERVDFSHIDCGTGGCPVDWNELEE